MQQPPDPPINQRLRTVRRRITAAVLATFVAAWLAVAAFGKGGDAGTTGATTTPSASGTSSQSDDSSSPTQSSGDFGSSQSTQGDPVTSSQS